MKTVLVTGSGGLIGSAAVKFYAEMGWLVIGIDNNQRKEFFGADGDVSETIQVQRALYKNYEPMHVDIMSDYNVIDYWIRQALKQHGATNVHHIIHAAAQPSHDKAADIPKTDFMVNAYGTFNMLELLRNCYPDASFAFLSTNKVYGDRPNTLNLFEGPDRYEIDDVDEGWTCELGFNERFSIDQSKHSLFGASKVAADVYVQEYGRYFGLKTGVFRGGCLTGPNHASAELHGFLSYIVKCALDDRPYTIFGYKGKQVRDQIHSYDVINALYHFLQAPRPGEVYNIGGGYANSASILEVVSYIKQKTGKELNYTYSETNRVGDHIVYYTDMSKFTWHYPDWKMEHSLDSILDDIIAAQGE